MGDFRTLPALLVVRWWYGAPIQRCAHCAAAHAARPTACTVANCAACQAGSPSECATCNAGYAPWLGKCAAGGSDALELAPTPPAHCLEKTPLILAGTLALETDMARRACNCTACADASHLASLA